MPSSTLKQKKGHVSSDDDSEDVSDSTNSDTDSDASSDSDDSNSDSGSEDSSSEDDDSESDSTDDDVLADAPRRKSSGKSKKARKPKKSDTGKVKKSSKTGRLGKAIQRIRKICDDSKNRSTVFNDGSQGYKDSVRHYVDSSSEVASIAVQPGNEEDLSKIIQCIAKYRVPFAVKGGGHSMVPGFSSTTGVQISMVRFNKVVYNSSDETVDVGAGCLWDEVYNELTPRKRNAVGGAARQGVGVAGWTLGGGYSLKSNQYGLGIDNVEAFKIVLPDGTICTATAKSKKYGDLYQGLRGGGNNFGIVTQFTLKTHKHRTGYGASGSIPGSKEKEAKKAIMDFVDNEKRPEAALVAAFRHSRNPGQSKINYVISTFCVFDDKKPSKNVPFQKFAKLIGPAVQTSSDPAGWNRQGQVYDMPTGPRPATPVVDMFREMSPDEMNGITASLYDIDDPPPYEEVESTPSDVQYAAPSAKKKSTKVKGMANLGELNTRGRFGCIMISKYTAGVVDTIASEAKKAAESLSKKDGRMVVIDVWPFLDTVFKRSPPGAAWPHNPKEPFAPCLAYFQWYNEKDDDFWMDAMKSALNKIRKVALSEGATVDKPAIYSNTSLEDVPVKQIYRDNLKWLSKLRKKYDRKDVMSLTGGFRIPLK